MLVFTDGDGKIQQSPAYAYIADVISESLQSFLALSEKRHLRRVRQRARTENECLNRERPRKERFKRRGEI
jgi:hypothetical protein